MGIWSENWLLILIISGALVVSTVALLIFIFRIVMRSTQEQVVTGLSGMIGLRGKAETELAPEGRVFVHGEIWQARTRGRIAAGEEVYIRGVDGLILEVVPAERNPSLIPKPVSIIETEAHRTNPDNQ